MFINDSFVKNFKFNSYYKCSWTIAILLWILIILFILSIVLKSKSGFLLSASFFICFYFLYLIFQLCHCCCGYGHFWSIRYTPEKMALAFKDLVKIKPTIGFNCYLYQGNSLIFNYQREFPYYTFRDISGLLNLNYGNSEKFYLYLKIYTELDFCDEITKADYENFKMQLEEEENRKYAKYKLNEFKYLGYYPNVIVEFGQSSPYKLSLFIILSLLTVGHIYLQIRDGPYEKEIITIKKVISSRNNLSEPKFNELYNDLNPMININNQIEKIDNFIFINTKYTNQNYNNNNSKNPIKPFIQTNMNKEIPNNIYYQNNQEISNFRRDMMGEMKNNNNFINSNETLSNLNIDSQPKYIEVNIKGNNFVNNNFVNNQIYKDRNENKEESLFKDNTRED